MAEEKKAVVNVTVTFAAKLYFKNCTNVASDTKIIFNMSDVPVDATDDQVKQASTDALAEEIKKGTGIIRCTLENDPSFIAIDTIACCRIKNVEIKRGE
jgi:hypothetical protein